MVGAVRLLSAAPVHQTLQLDQKQLLGSGGDGRGGQNLRAGPAPVQGEVWGLEAPQGGHGAQATWLGSPRQC